MEVFVLLKGYDYEGFGSDVEVFSTRKAAEARKQAYRDGNGIVDNHNPNITYDYGYDILKIVKHKPIPLEVFSDKIEHEYFDFKNVPTQIDFNL